MDNVKINKLNSFNKQRKNDYIKKENEENFLLQINKVLQKKEKSFYNECNETYPFIFVFGLPRSGTTLLTQTISHFFNIGYINNFMAKFWLAPLTGIKMSKMMFGNNNDTNYQSDYAATKKLTDIHEFGYFWRQWLKKESMNEIINSKNNEEKIKWDQLKNVLLNIQQEFGKGLCAKNIYGSYHIEKFIKKFKKVLWVYIEREESDVAISILEARKKYYKNLNLWWSYVPLEYNELKNLPYKEQIGGQIYYLKKYYNDIIDSINGKNIVIIKYKDLCQQPSKELMKIKKSCEKFCDYNLEFINKFPRSFNYNVYKNRTKEKEEFLNIIEQFRKRDNDET